MISDVIAYPERIVDLLDNWCSNQLAERMVVTVKFQGDTPAWELLENAKQVARSHGYRARAKHFFNNKNEATLMLEQESTESKKKESSWSESSSGIMTPMYGLVWPKH